MCLSTEALADMKDEICFTRRSTFDSWPLKQVPKAQNSHPIIFISYVNQLTERSIYSRLGPNSSCPTPPGRLFLGVW